MLRPSGCVLEKTEENGDGKRMKTRNGPEKPTAETVRARLEALAEPGYAQFSSSLLPGVENILGVRLPALRRTAQEIVRADWRAFLKEARDDSFEEIMLQGMVIGAADTNLSEKTDLVRLFVPKISNWSVCDSFCASLKINTPEDKKAFMPVIREYAFSEKTYDVRFAAVMLLMYYTDADDIDSTFELLGQMRPDGYYAKMGIAWAVSVCFVSSPEKTMRFLKEKRLDDETYSMALRKITESGRVDPETKKTICAMRKQN